VLGTTNRLLCFLVLLFSLPFTCASAIPPSPPPAVDPLGDARYDSQFERTLTPDGAVVSVSLTGTTPGDVDPSDPGAEPPPNASFCWGGVTSIPADNDVKVFRDIITVINNKRVTTKDYVRTNRTYTFLCNGQIMKTVTKCIAGDCPPPPPPKPVSIRKIVRAAVSTKQLKLPAPNMTFSPPITKNGKTTDAPLVGFPQYYGVTPEQFNTGIDEQLQVCFDEDCGSIRIGAQPRVVHFRPNNAWKNNTMPNGIKSTCKQAMPVVRDLADARRIGDACAITFQNAGVYGVDFILEYELIWSLNRWTFTQRPPTETGSQRVYVPKHLSLHIKQIQPVIIR
jgi:hypothetical protein